MKIEFFRSGASSFCHNALKPVCSLDSLVVMSLGGVKLSFGLMLSGFLLIGCLPSHSLLEEEKEPHYLAGKSRVSARDYSGAVEAFSKALEVNPKSGAAHLELGWLYDQKEGDPAAAIYHYSKYLTFRPRAENADTIKTRILACKQELARTVSLGPVTQAMQREFEQLAMTNKRLVEEVEKWKAYAESLQALTNRPAVMQAQGEPVSASKVYSDGGNTSVRKSEVVQRNARTHTVKPGETLTQISQKYGVKLSALQSANPRLDPRRMKVGDVVKIP